MHEYKVHCLYTKGRWFGRGNIAPIREDLTSYDGVIQAYSEKQAMFLLRKKLEKLVGLPYMVDIKVF